MLNDLRVFENVPFYTTREELRNDLRVGDFVVAKIIPESNTFARVVSVTVNGAVLDCPAVVYYTDILFVCKVARVKDGE